MWVLSEGKSNGKSRSGFPAGMTTKGAEAKAGVVLTRGRVFHKESWCAGGGKFVESRRVRWLRFSVSQVQWYIAASIPFRFQRRETPP